MVRERARKGRTSAARTMGQPRAGSGQALGTLLGTPASAREWLRQAVSWGPYVVVFAASACGLIIEIVAARILAPNVGVSLYTWTSVIGVVLAGISVGNYLGGRAADRFPSPATLAHILLAAGVSSLIILVLVGAVSDAYEALPLVPRIVLLTATLFFLPSLILGMVTPVVIKLRLKDLAQAGNVVGKVYAIATAGAIFGTFMTGFVLIQWIGSRQTLLLVASVLIVMALALALGNVWRVKAPFVALMAVFIGLTSAAFTTGAFDSGCLRESNYYCIQVTDTVVQGDLPVKVLRLDKLLHTFVSPEDPTLLVQGYQKVFAEIEAYVAQRNPSLRVLFIGGGGYANPRHLEAVYPESTVEVIEIDPEVTRVATEYLGLRPDTRIVTYNEDARMAVSKLARGQYDLVIGDAFHDVSIPYHLTTKEFNEQVGALLKDSGIYAVNAVDKLHTGGFLRAYVNTLQQTFPYVSVIQDVARWEDNGQRTYVVAASFQPLSATALENASILGGRSQSVSRLMPEDTFESWLRSKGTITLTDDYAPVANLMAPIYLDRTTIERARRDFNAGLELEDWGRLLEAMELLEEIE
ncbi:MAG: fused MFS/spermidine synthase [Chloroflexi bacterium]|nr:fused MFS/spermidine synthase [Chloroflexota bacterium]